MTHTRPIIRIDQEKCNGCGQCVTACAEGAVRIIDGKARLVSESYCDGLGACLGTCPQDAITIEQRQAAPFDEQATSEHLKRLKEKELDTPQPLPCACPSAMVRQVKHSPAPLPPGAADQPAASQLANWPVQLHLVPPTAPYLRSADLLLVADCVPFALADFHQRFLRGKPVLIGCPKLDDADSYVAKLTDILNQNEISSIAVLHMEVPCCSGLVYITRQALIASGKTVPAQDVTISINGQVIQETHLQVNAA